MEYGLIGLLHLALVIWAVIKILDSGASTEARVVWVLIVLVFPVIGFLIWFLAGPK